MTDITQQHTCSNCGHTAAAKYCSQCGEALIVHRITIKHILHEVVHLFTHFDKGVLYTIKQLILQPGVMQKEYLAGKRTLHQKPFALFFLCGTVTALALYWINIATGKLYADADLHEGHFYQHYFTIAQMCLVPAYAMVTYLVFGKRYNYAEYLVIILYNTSILFMFVCLANILKLVFGAFETGYIEIGFVVLYNIFTNFNLFNDKPKMPIVLKTLLSSIICFAISRVAMEVVILFFIPHN
jgi:hypothetical protein